eukprot:TRINITY_DN4378_c0_g1_i2.p1 TRINITY_DN4378_c0_g1~~TRINITY_DN4378_c0_g1_i2.p1  ORF type:complete len:300 (-),score=105.45 TRINITY_DN4378_c0_g1_i2:688-1548(-)
MQKRAETQHYAPNAVKAAVSDPRDPTATTKEKLSELQSVPRFLSKLYDIFSNAAFQAQGTCGWGAGGASIVIHDVHTFTSAVLPQYFNHGNFQSFVRQLNMYNFKKTVAPGLSLCEFSHPLFRRGRAEQLRQMKCKPPSTSGVRKKATMRRQPQRPPQQQHPRQRSTLASAVASSAQACSVGTEARAAAASEQHIEAALAELRKRQDGVDSEIRQLQADNELVRRANDALLQHLRARAERSRASHEIICHMYSVYLAAGGTVSKSAHCVRQRAAAVMCLHDASVRV